MTTAATVPIHLDDRGVAWVDETNVKVKEIVLDQIAYGWAPEEMHYQHPHLSMAQIHAALSYYYEHKDEMDAEMERDDEETATLRAEAEATQAPIRARLLERWEAMGRAPR